MKTLLLCGYRGSEILGLDRDDCGRTRIDTVVAELRGQGHQVICVLAGAAADRQLREATSIQDCELAFDDTQTPDLKSNVLAGLTWVDRQPSSGMASIARDILVVQVEAPCHSPHRLPGDALKRLQDGQDLQALLAQVANQA